MKKSVLSLLLLIIALSLFSQDFFRGDFNKGKDYVILTNPTVGNIETIRFLINKGLLDIDTGKVNFVGVYNPAQKYDFSQTSEYLRKSQTSVFFLHEQRGDLTEKNLFRENPCTGEIQFIFRNSIGIFFFGGPDIPPAVYGENNLYSVVTDPQRHYFELTYLFHLLGSNRNPGYKALLEENPEYFVTGFCLGLQTMNVATGGSLYQDIPAQLYQSFDPDTILNLGQSKLHRNYWQNKEPKLTSFVFHKIRFTESDFFGHTIKLRKGLKPMVFSSHHQTINKIGEGLEVTVLSADDKVIEGLVHTKYPNVFSVQFHPEYSALFENREKMIFNPSDKPQTLYRRMNRKSLRFHKKYWSHISEVLEENTLR